MSESPLYESGFINEILWINESGVPWEPDPPAPEPAVIFTVIVHEEETPS